MTARLVAIAGHRDGLTLAEALDDLDRSKYWRISRRGCSVWLFDYGLRIAVRRRKGETLAGMIVRCVAKLRARRKSLVS